MFYLRIRGRTMQVMLFIPLKSKARSRQSKSWRNPAITVLSSPTQLVLRKHGLIASICIPRPPNAAQNKGWVVDAAPRGKAYKTLWDSSSRGKQHHKLQSLKPAQPNRACSLAYCWWTTFLISNTEGTKLSTLSALYGLFDRFQCPCSQSPNNF